jgi:hypothetical protein
MYQPRIQPEFNRFQQLSTSISIRASDSAPGLCAGAWLSSPRNCFARVRTAVANAPASTRTVADVTRRRGVLPRFARVLPRFPCSAEADPAAESNCSGGTVPQRAIRQLWRAGNDEGERGLGRTQGIPVRPVLRTWFTSAVLRESYAFQIAGTNEMQICSAAVSRLELSHRPWPRRCRC